MRINTAVLSLATLLLVACQQGQASNSSEAERLVPPPVVEPIDPVSNPVAAMKARKQQMSVETDLGTLRAEIMALIGEARADNVQQCRVVAFGAKPCGGPAEYVAVSIKGKDEATVLNKINAYNQAAEADNLRQGRMSDCAVVPKPQVQLVNGQCTLVNEVTY